MSADVSTQTHVQQQQAATETLSTEEQARIFELAKLDYVRLGTQEQSLMEARWQIWVLFFAIVAGPTGYAGIAGVHGSVLLIGLIPFFLTCLALSVKHSEMVLRYDIRKPLKELAKRYHYDNHESRYSKAQQAARGRFWHGWYKHGMGAAFLVAQSVAVLFVRWYCVTNGLGTWALIVMLVGAGFVLVTWLCFWS